MTTSRNQGLKRDPELDFDSKTTNLVYKIKVAIRDADKTDIGHVDNQRWAREALRALVEDDFDGDPLSYCFDICASLLLQSPYWPAIERGIRLSIDRYPKPPSRSLLYGLIIRNLYFVEVADGTRPETYQQTLGFLSACIYRSLDSYPSTEW